MQDVFSCAMCGHCCKGQGGIILAQKDVVRLADFLEVSEDEFLAAYTEPVHHKICIKTAEDKFCLFYVKERGCKVHEARPDICRAWPFFRGNLVDSTSWQMAHLDCPGINVTVEHEAFVRAGLFYLKKLEIDTGDPKAPGALLDIPGLPENKV